MLAGGLYERTSGVAGQPLAGYRRREPERTVLYELVAQHAQTMLAEVRAADPEGGGLPRYVERELTAYLRCGVLAHGFFLDPADEHDVRAREPFARRLRRGARARVRGTREDEGHAEAAAPSPGTLHERDPAVAARQRERAASQATLAAAASASSTRPSAL